MSVDARALGSNLLLASLPEGERARLLRRLKVVSLAEKEVLREPGEPLDHIYFPCKGTVISRVLSLADDHSIELWLVGHEGMVGVEAFLGSLVARFRASVQVGGEALRMRAEDFLAAARRGRALADILRRYLELVLLHTAQIAACNRFHSLEEHFCFWLLQFQDRVGSPQFEITHETLGKALGMRRVGVTQTARKLQDAGLIRYRWGKFEIVDRHGVEARACECYDEIKRAYQRLLPQPAAPPSSL
jgi:CRP-like cAMP-binding protein